MALTPNYSFIIPTGTDAVNLLTQCYPNFSSLDNILKPIQESGVTVATDTKLGTVHQLVRTDSSCNMFRFIATANYASGDTFTVDGVSVTATAMDGTALPAGAFVINQSVVCVLNSLVLTVMIAGKETSSLAATAVTYDNTISGLTATNAQDAIDELHDSANIAYDNTVSGLTAANVQSAIDEIATSAPGTNHGVYEVWANSAPGNDYAASTFSVSSAEEYDGFFVLFEESKNETIGSIVRYVDKAFNSISFRHDTYDMPSNDVVSVYRYSRSFDFSYSAGTYTFTIGDCSLRYKKTNSSSAAATTTQNANFIPVRILGLVHNT